jgi:DNA-binding NarL/FixJ family response regulator
MTASRNKLCPACRRPYPERYPWEPRELQSTSRATLAILTTRQREVARLVAVGYRNAEIARLLGVKRATVQNHLSAIYLAAGLPSRSEIRKLFGEARIECAR